MINPVKGYQVTEEQYCGTNTVIYRAIRESDHLAVVLKTATGECPTAEQLGRYRHEFEIINLIKSDRIIKVISIEQEEMACSLVLEDCGGVSLAQLIKDNYAFTIPEILTIASNTITGISQIHAANVIHKDINPSNIIYNPESGDLKIIDFGISSILPKEQPTICNPAQLQGTLAYIAPEQTGRMNRAVDYRADFYSLGITLYELTVGQVPFQSEQALEIIHGHIAGVITPPHVTNPEIPKALSDIILKLTAKTAEERYQGSWGIKADLTRCIEQYTLHQQIEPFKLATFDLPDRFEIPQKLYGRSREVNEIVSLFDQVEQGRFEFVLISGFSGIGKTSLVREVHKPLTRRKGYFVSGKFDQFCIDKPFSAISIAFSQLIKQILTEGINSIALWKHQINTHLGENISVLAELIPDIKHIVGPQEPSVSLDARLAKSRFQVTLQSFIRIFAQRKLPLIIFLDDLQWADAASFSLIHLFLTDKNNHYLLLLGAYRDNEVGPSHPLTHLINELEEESAPLHAIKLDKLPELEIQHLVADALYRTQAEVADLALLVSNKTRGNPFFIEQLLKNIYANKLLYFDTEAGQWCWDIERIRLADISDNVVDLISSKIRQLPQLTQEILFVGACTGNVFPLNILCHITQNKPKEIELILKEASIQGLVIPIGNTIHLELSNQELINKMAQGESIDYRFAHDRIQQSAYNFFPESQRQQIDYKLGWFFYHHDARVLDEKIFDVVNHLNNSSQLINTTQEKSTVVKLNYQSMLKAKRSGAYKTAHGYGLSALKLMDDQWQASDYEQNIDLYTQLAEVCSLLGLTEEMNAYIDLVVTHAKNTLDKVHALEKRFASYSVRREHAKAISIGVDALQMLGLKIPKNPTSLDMTIKLAHFFLVANRKLNSIDKNNLPETTDETHIAVLRILAGLSTSAFVATRYLPIYLGLTSVQYSVKHGFCGFSEMGFSNSAVLFSSILEQFEKGREFSQWSMRIAERFDAGQHLAKASFMGNYIIGHWFKPISEINAPLQQAYRDAVQAGAFQLASSCLVCNLNVDVLAGRNLSSVMSNSLRVIATLSDIKLDESNLRAVLVAQVCENLTSTRELSTLLVGNYYDEHCLTVGLEVVEDRAATFTAYVYKIILAIVFEQMDANTEYLAKTRLVSKMSRGTANTKSYHFLMPLAYLLCLHKFDTKARKQHISFARKHLKKLIKYTPVCEINCLHKMLLVQAELTAHDQNYEAASRLYTEACNAAVNGQNVFEKALCEEFAGRFYLRQKQSIIAYIYLKKAYSSYQEWGSKAKLIQLNRKYAELFETQSVDLLNNNLSPDLYTRDLASSLSGNNSSVKNNAKPNNSINAFTATATATDGLGLDISSISKAYELIAGEINLDQLINKILKLVMENAGAEKVYLILNDKTDSWHAVGFNSVQSSNEDKGADNNHQIFPTNIEDSTNLPLSVINYVINSGESVVIRNAQQNNHFANDPHVIAAKIKSTLCIPLKKQNKTIGILYAENNELEGAFSESRVRILDIIAAQGAVAIENAKLYTSLRESENQYRGVFENSIEGIFQLSLSHKIVLANRSFIRILGYADLSTLTQQRLHFNEQFYVNKTHATAITNTLKKTKKVVDFQTQFYKQDDTTIEVLLSIQLVVDDKDQPLRYDGMLKDITSQTRNAELTLEKEKIEAVANAKSDFLAAMSHEIRTPMNGVIGIADILKDTGLNSMQKHYVDVITDSGNALVNIINDILDFSKIESGKMEIESIQFDLIGLLNKCAALFSTKSSENQVALFTRFDTQLPPSVFGDPTRLRQVLLNLLGNAFKFTEQGTVEIEISLKERSDTQCWIKFSIRDSGVGISDSAQKDLFQSYAQAESSTSRKFGGTGLGLSISKQLVELMHGEIGVNSTLGKGSEFWFCLPMTPDAATVPVELVFSPCPADIVVYSDSPILINALSNDFSVAPHKISYLTDLDEFNEAILLAHSNQSHCDFFCHSVLKPELLWQQFMAWTKLCELTKGLRFIYLSEPAARTNFQWIEDKNNPQIQSTERPLSAHQFLQTCNTLLINKQAAIHTQDNGEKSIDLSHLNVLVAEDNLVNQIVIKTMLTKLKTQVTLANDGQEALDLYRNSFDKGQSTYHVIFMDCEMPVLNGFDASRAIRAFEHQQDVVRTPIFAVTAHALSEYIDKCLDSGMDEVITKPFLKKDIIVKLEAIDTSHRQQ